MDTVNGPLPAAPQPDIERALPAMRDMGIFHADDERPKFGERQPKRHLTPEHPRLGGPGIMVACRPASRRSLSGDDERDFGAGRLRALQETQKRRVRVFLGEAVQIKPRIDRHTTAGNALFGAPIEWRKRRRFFRYR